MGVIAQWLRKPHEIMTLNQVVTIIDRLLRETMLGRSKLDVGALLVARALVSHLEQPARIWRIYEVAREAASKLDSIACKRKALAEGSPILAQSTFDVLQDTWVCYVAIEAGVEEARAVAVELLEPYRYDDCGCVVDVKILTAMPMFLHSSMEQWILDLENLAGTATRVR